MLVDDERLVSLSRACVDIAYLEEDLCKIVRDGVPDGLRNAKGLVRNVFA